MAHELLGAKSNKLIVEGFLAFCSSLFWLIALGRIKRSYLGELPYPALDFWILHKVFTQQR